MDTQLIIQENYSRKLLKKEAAKLTEGIEDPLSAWAKLSRFEDLAKYAKSEIQPLVHEVVKENEDDELPTEKDGIRVTREAGRVSWDFSHNPEWVELKERIKEIEGNMKKVATSVGTIIINEETGEEYPAAVMKMGNPFLKTHY